MKVRIKKLSDRAVVPKKAHKTVNPGARFGRLTVICVDGSDKYYRKYWKCQCDCGNEIRVIGGSLLRGNTRSCGCLNNEIRRKKHKGPNCVCDFCGKEFRIKPGRIAKLQNTFCSMKCYSSYRKEHIEKNPRYKKRTEVEKFFDEKFTRWKCSAKKRGIPFDNDLTPSDLVSLWTKQSGRCYYSGVKMSFDKSDKLRLVSIDRIDSSIGYRKDNIVLCSYAFNSFKFTYGRKEIIEFINSIRRSVKIKARLGEFARIPTKATQYSAGLDLYSNMNTTIAVGNRQLLSTGLSMEIPNGFYGMVVGRSGNTIKRGMVVPVGIIDADYRGNIGVMAFNQSDEDIEVKIGDRIGQLIIMPIPDIEFEEADELSETDRGTGGYGSTGK